MTTLSLYDSRTVGAAPGFRLGDIVRFVTLLPVVICLLAAGGIGLSDRFETGPSATGNSGIGIVIIAGLERSGRRVYTGPVLARR